MGWILSLRIHLLPTSHSRLAALPVEVHRLRSLVDLRVAALTEICHSKVLPRMAMGRQSILIHNPTVGAECDLFSSVGIRVDGHPIEALDLVEFRDDWSSLLIKVLFGEDDCDQRARLLLLEHLPYAKVLADASPRVQG